MSAVFIAQYSDSVYAPAPVEMLSQLFGSCLIVHLHNCGTYKWRRVCVLTFPTYTERASDSSFSSIVGKLLA